MVNPIQSCVEPPPPMHAGVQCGGPLDYQGCPLWQHERNNARHQWEYHTYSYTGTTTKALCIRVRNAGGHSTIRAALFGTNSKAPGSSTSWCIRERNVGHQSTIRAVPMATRNNARQEWEYWWMGGTATNAIGIRVCSGTTRLPGSPSLSKRQQVLVWVLHDACGCEMRETTRLSGPPSMAAPLQLWVLVCSSHEGAQCGRPLNY